jgi:Tfp pilus assembly protein PilO
MEQKNPNPAINKKPAKKLSDYFKVGEKDQTMTLMVLIILICFGLGYFVFMPIASNYNLERIKTANLDREKNNLNDKQIVLKGLQTDLDQRAPFIDLTNNAMPTTSQIPELLVTLSQLASNNSLYMTNFSPKPEDVPKTGTIVEYSTVKVEFDVKGSYLDLKQFLKDIESNLRPINITSINISGGGEISKETSTEILQFNVNCEVYYKAQ